MFLETKRISVSLNEKRGKGKPKMIFDEYHKWCRQMLLENNAGIEQTNDPREKLRLQNLNSSLLQRLRKRREEENQKEINNNFNFRLNLLIKSYNDITSQQQKKQLIDELGKNGDTNCIEFDKISRPLTKAYFEELMEKYLEKKVRTETITDI